jgi:glycosyltransferase involved in cell wall biosynthesis
VTNKQNRKLPERILYVENGIGYGGAIICLRHLVRNLDRTRFTPMVVTGRTGPHYEEIAQEASWKHLPDHRIDVITMKRRLQASGWVQKVPSLYFILSQILARLDDALNFLPHFLQLLWTAARFRAALVHVNNEPLCNRAAILAAKVLRIPVVCHVRGDPGLDQNKSHLAHWLYGLPDHFIPVSHWISGGIGKLGVPENKRTVVYDGIRLDEMDQHADGTQFRKEFGIPDQAFAVGLVGLLIPWKGQDLFIDAARVLTAEIPELKMLVIGGTPEECTGYEQELRQRVTREGLDDSIIFTGHVTNMPVVYNGLDIVVSASTLPEPLGTVVIECMAMGRALIGPNHGGAAEMADHEETALLFEPGNGVSLASAIRRLYQDSDLRKQLGQNARTRALATFSVDEHVRRIQAIYDTLQQAATKDN